MVQTKKISKHIIPIFKECTLDSIEISLINNWRKSIENINGADTHKNQIIGYMQEILKYAVNNYNLDNKIASKLQKQVILIELQKLDDNLTIFLKKASKT